MNYIDVHCHLDCAEYGDIPSFMERLCEAGVKKIVAAGYDLATSRLSAEFAEKYPFCYFTAGFHPTELSDYSDSALREIAGLARHPKCVAIGEIGLDYHYPETDKPLQREAFLSQLKLARDLGMPVQIHSRDCAEDMLEILSSNPELISCGALLHCYSHSCESAVQFEKLGLYFSFGGASTWRSNKKAARTISALAADRLLTETDSPYMPPASLYGTFPNTPASIPEILKNMAEIRGTGVSDMADIVWENAHRLFPKLKNRSLL